jgi:hypothetical protein
VSDTRLEAGSQFRMQMKGYTTLNRVVEHRQDALIAWRHRGRHVWRWELRPQRQALPVGRAGARAAAQGGRRARADALGAARARRLIPLGSPTLTSRHARGA